MKLSGIESDSGLVVDIERCARCGGDHEQLQFLPLHNAQDEYEFWSLCPELGEPLLCKVIRKALPEVKGEG